jgi:hypothetical protein
VTDYDNINRGAIWKNKDKQKDTHPDFKGELDVGGRKYWVSAWKRREDASPKAPALSFSIEPKEEQEKPISQRALDKVHSPDRITTGRQLPPKQSIIPDDSDIPF